ncbi:hypothetical protein QFC22_006523 [Naganishia vaughanmartiniae]|uniref:Uncharacterized protein n=1 Tax=Naganishia vaughanmartiniae TaxID=1424756 RepID=A0ACC2WK73_9TREE|nr:hypothetical protein QFC22_006523 [Naganishia vaughanmartiniae]
MTAHGLDYKPPVELDRKASIEMIENTGDLKELDALSTADAQERQPTVETCFEGYTEEETKQQSKKLVRLIDFRVLPVLILLFLLNILDRNNIANAKVSGMSTDLKFNNLDYNNAILAMFVGYVAMQIPAGFILAKVPPAFFLSGAVFCWGIVSMCCGFLKNKEGLIAMRFLVGVAEAPFFPGALLILSSFYTRKEIAIRIAIMYSGNSLSNCFGGLIAAGVISGMEGKGGLRGWQWLFVLEGAATAFVGIAVYWILPSYPSKCKFFNDEQRRLSVWRTTQDAMGEADEGETSLKKGAKLVFKDWKILMLIFQQMFISCSQSFSYFMPTIVKTLGYNTNQTLLLTAPPYMFAFLCSVAVAYSSSRFDERGYHIAVPMAIACVGNILVIALPKSQVAGRYIAMFLLCLGSYCAFNLSFAWVTSTIPRPKVKRAAALSLVNGLANASHFFSPYFFSDKVHADRNGGIALAVFSILVSCTAMTIKFTLQAQNRKMDRLDEQDKPYTGSLEGIPKGYRFIS